MRHAIVVMVVLLAPFSVPPVEAQGVDLLGITDGSATMPAGSSNPRFDGSILDLLGLARRTRTRRTSWRADRPLSDARNAHVTNTHGQMRKALEGGYSFLEGDVREEINRKGQLEMRHDVIHEGGDNLSLGEWLAIGKASGRGLKLDVKEPDHMEQILSEVESAGVSQDCLMFNLGSAAMERWGRQTRQQFPRALLAINPPPGDGPLSAAEIKGMVDQARRFGAPVTFVVHLDRLTDEAIQALRAWGPVSVWNSTYTGRPVTDPDGAATALRRRGVDGVIDLRRSEELPGKLSRYLDWGVNAAHNGADNVWRKVRSVLPW